MPHLVPHASLLLPFCTLSALLLFIHHLPSIDKQGLLRTPQLTIKSTPVNQLLMRAQLSYIPLSQHNDNIGIVDGTQAMRDEDGSTFLLLDERVDMAEKGLFGVGVEGRGLR